MADAQCAASINTSAVRKCKMSANIVSNQTVNFKKNPILNRSKDDMNASNIYKT